MDLRYLKVQEKNESPPAACTLNINKKDYYYYTLLYLNLEMKNIHSTCFKPPSFFLQKQKIKGIF